MALTSESRCIRLGECDCHHPVKEEKKPSERIAEIALENLRRELKIFGHAAFLEKGKSSIEAIIQYLDEQHGK